MRSLWKSASGAVQKPTDDGGSCVIAKRGTGIEEKSYTNRALSRLDTENAHSAMMEVWWESGEILPKIRLQKRARGRNVHNFIEWIKMM